MENWLIKCGTSKESDTRDKDHLDKSECNSRECNSEKENEYESDDETLSMDVTLDASQPKKRKILRQRLNKFSDSWLAIPDFKNWLSKSTTTLSKFQGKHDLAYCNVCKTEIVSHKSGIFRHSQSNKHKLNINCLAVNNKLTDLYKTTPLDENVKTAELKLSGMLATNNLPFLLMDTLAPLCRRIFPDSEIAKRLSVKRTKATSLVTNSLGKTFLEKLCNTLQVPGCFFSIIMDETTDVSSKKQCAFTVIYFDLQHGLKVKTSFLDMVEISSSTADGLYNTLKTVITSNKLPFSNFVGFSSDTTNVMVGQHHSVFSLLKSEFPNIVSIKCSCHMIHLSACKACLKLPRSVEDLLRNLGSHFNRSFLRQEKFREFQLFFKTDIHKILSRATTRWLSLKQCTDRVLEQYDPLKAYLRELVFSDPSITNEEMSKTMENHFTKIYLEFVSYTLGIVNDFNLMFQSEMPLLHKLKSEVAKLLRTFCSNFLKIVCIRKETNVFKLDHTNPTNFVVLEKVYIGIQASESFTTLKKEPNIAQADIEKFLQSCLNFYVELVSDIKNRFDFSDKLFEIIDIVEPNFAYSFKINSLKIVLERFPVLNDFVDAQALDNEWKEHALLNHNDLNIDLSCNVEKYWNQIFSLKNAAGAGLFENLKKIITFLLILPFSNASVERIFSELKNIKTDHRNSLNTDTIKAIIATKEGIPNIVEFKPDKRMLCNNIWTEKQKK